MIDRLKNLEKSQKVFNVQLNHYGEIRPQEAKDERINEFRYVYCNYVLINEHYLFNAHHNSFMLNLLCIGNFCQV